MRIGKERLLQRICLDDRREMPIGGWMQYLGLVPGVAGEVREGRGHADNQPMSGPR